MKRAIKAEKPRKQAISGRFWVARTYRGRIKDDHKIDPAFGSGVMFMQAARYMHKHNNASEAEVPPQRCEKEPDTVKLAKTNLLLSNIRGDITEANSFYKDEQPRAR